MNVNIYKMAHMTRNNMYTGSLFCRISRKIQRGNCSDFTSVCEKIRADTHLHFQRFLADIGVILMHIVYVCIERIYKVVFMYIILCCVYKIIRTHIHKHNTHKRFLDSFSQRRPLYIGMYTLL